MNGPAVALRLCRQQCRHSISIPSQVRSLHAFPTLLSGHSRWSTIRHDKAKNDAAKNKQRSVFAQEIATASKFWGPDPGTNPRLHDLIVKAKKNGFAKTSIEAAIARGQGKSPTGAALESCIIEGILPGNIGIIVDCETDSRGRTLQNLRLVLKKHGGVASPSNYLFEKKGRVVFEPKEETDMDEVLEAALEAGALDVEEDEQGIVVFTEPNEVRAVADGMGTATGLDVSSSGIVWTPNADTAVTLEGEETVALMGKLVDDLHENDSTVQGVYLNVVQGSLDDGAWADLRAKVNV